MGPLETGVLFAPVAAGITALCTAPAAIRSRKGGVWDRRWGNIFFGAIAVLVVSALTSPTMRHNLLPALYTTEQFVDAAGLMSYGISVPHDPTLHPAAGDGGDPRGRARGPQR